MQRGHLKQIFKTPDLRKRILAVFGMILVFRILSHIPIPLGDPVALQDFLRSLFESTRLFTFVDLFSGGALSRFSIVLLGLGPYINASIILQLLTQAVPRLSELKKEGEEGQRKINRYTRYLTLPLAIGQSIGMVFLLRQLSIQVGQVDVIGSPSLSEWALLITTMTAGSMLLMWLGELITEKGVGNGISLLIAAGIIAQVPSLAGQAATLLKTDTSQVITILLFTAASLLITYFIVKLNEAHRTIKVSYAKRMRAQSYGGVESSLPIRILTAGVIPIIFAVIFLSVPPSIGRLFAGAKSVWLADFAANLTRWFDPSSTAYAITYFLLVIMFTYFYTGIAFNAKDIAESLQRQGGFIPGIRPGRQTEVYLRKIVNRITLFGSISLGVIAVLPFIGERLTGSSFLTFGGTGLLIVVSVAIESLRQIESQIINATYK